MSDAYGSLSFWLDDVPGGITPRPALGTTIDADVAIVGAGFTGLWSAYYLAKADPGLRVVLLEREVAGSGASGRNGGWCSPQFPTPLHRLADEHGPEAARSTDAAMLATVDEIGRVAAAEGIDAQFHKGGCLNVSTSPAQTRRLREGMKELDALAPEHETDWLERDQVADRVRVAGALAGTFTPAYSSLHPARLARGLADVVERLGVRLFERTPALSVSPGFVATPGAGVRAPVVLRATEAYTPALPGYRRALIPAYSRMIATAPLPQSFWREVGWSGRELLCDGRHLIVYAMRSADDRIVLGGTREDYHFGSRLDRRLENDGAVFARIHEALCTWFPSAAGAGVTHTWGGPFAIARDWHCSVGLDRATGLAWAGGYVGNGVATANLAGRTLADLILSRDSGLVRLPWVGHRSPDWEPEPLRWLGASFVEGLLERADRAEFERERTWRGQPLLDRVGRYVGW